jgi:beta-lactamase regulating signal transducer with metallopeptidase domain
MTALVVESVLRSIVLAAMVWAGLSLLRVRHVLAQKIAWGLVLLVSFAMPLVIHWQSSHPGTALVVPVKRTTTLRALRQKAAAIRIDPIPFDVTDATAGTSPLSFAPVVSVRPAYTAIRKTWRAPALRLSDLIRYILPTYLIVAGALLLRLLIGLALAMRIWYRAERASPLVEPRANVRISSSIHSPVTIGSGIVLPASYLEWDRAKLRLVLAHERSHVRQGDFYLQLLASFYTALVWFSPLGWWLKHRLADLGEALSDHAALEEADDNSSYAEVLLQFAAMPRHGFAGTTAGVGMARSSNIQRRIERILNESIFSSAFRSGRRHAVIAALLVPAGLVLATSLLHVQAAERVKARTVAALTPPQNAKAWTAPTPQASLSAMARTRLAQLTSSVQVAPPATSAVPGLGALARTRLAQLTALVQVAPPPPPPVPAVLSFVTPAPAVSPVPALTLLAPPAPAATAMIIAPNPAKLTLIAPQAAVQQQIVNDSDEDEDGSHFAIIDRDKGSFYSHNVSWGDGGQAKRLAKDIQGSFIWFERDGKSYVITDPEVVNRAKALFSHQNDINRRQAELGERQAELGREQARMSQQQTEVKVHAPDISKQMADLQRSIQKLAQENAGQVTQENLSSLQEKLGEMQEKLASAQETIGNTAESIGERREEFSRQQEELGRRQEELGRQQEELGRMQEGIADEATGKVKSIIDQAYHDGKAKPVN